MESSHYTNRLFDFLQRLDANNNREWFRANKGEYDELRSLWLNDIDRMIGAMSQWAPELKGLTAKNCAYRIYRDTRFSPDKSPLKTYFSASFSPHGRKPHSAGFYIQTGPDKTSSMAQSGVYGGVWCPDTATLKKLRKAIVDNIEEFEEIINEPEMVKLFPGWWGESLKTVPKGYDRNHPLAHLLRRKDYGKFHPLDKAFFNDPQWPLAAADTLQPLMPLIRFLDYSINEEVL